LAEVSSFQNKIGVTFNNLSLLELALTHSSFINENPGIAPEPNERLEFLGDSVLGLIMAEKLYLDFPDAPEGTLTRLRSALVRRETLAKAAETLGLGDYLILGKGEESGGGRNKPINLAGAFEALIAAIYLDLGWETVRSFIIKLFGPEVYQQACQETGADFKSRLQEIMQAERQITPSYHLISASGPDHAKHFLIEVRAGEVVLSRGTGMSKKSAEMDAARCALERLARPESQT